MANSLYPASIKIDYQSAYGLHSMSIPTAKLAFDAGDYKFMKEDLTFIGVMGTLITAWVNAIKVFYPATTTFISWQGFTYATPTATADPLTSGTLNIAGTNALTGGGYQIKATQAVYTWRTDEFGLFKINLLDCAIADFTKQVSASHGNVSPLHAIVAGSNTWMRGRDGGLPQTFLQVSYGLNKKLRKAYRMN